MPEVAHAQRDSGTATSAPHLPRARRLLLPETDRGRTTGPLSLRIVEIPIASRLHLRSLRSPLRSTRVTDPVTQRLGVAMKFGDERSRHELATTRAFPAGVFRHGYTPPKPRAMPARELWRMPSSTFGHLCLLKTSEGRERLEIFLRRPYRRGHGDDSFRPRFYPRIPSSQPRLPGT
jgi:hypothetical protein